MNKSSQSTQANPLEDAIENEIQQWQSENKVKRLWQGDPTLWTNEDETKWLGWLKIPNQESFELQQIDTLAKNLIAEGYKHVVVLGMGGSSLTPAMMAETFSYKKDYPQLHVLDSTDPMQIRHLEEKLNLDKTLFIVSSKSGTTLEPNIFKDYFYHRMQAHLKKTEVGDRFIAITDPKTKLETIAENEQFRAIFYGIPSIGGRYSALSNFGMVPSGLMGLDIHALLQTTEKMVSACKIDAPVQDNPGVLLGIILGICAKFGKNKVTLIVSPKIKALGAWLEQLLAESTGKQGKGLIPIDNEPLGAPEVYSSDRIFVYIRLKDEFDDDQDRALEKIEASGQKVIKIPMENKEKLGQALFQWEIATAVAGSVMGINPFNQPDVEGSKQLAHKLISEYSKTKHIKEPKLIVRFENMQLLSDEANEMAIKKITLDNLNFASVLKAHLNRLTTGDYFNISAFIEMSDEHIELLQECRVIVRDKKKIATCLGFGPRFLHSSGQAYKGGPNTGVFLQITADPPQDLEVPGTSYTFGTVLKAQAEADFEVLTERKRRVLRLHLSRDLVKGLKTLRDIVYSL